MADSRNEQRATPQVVGAPILAAETLRKPVPSTEPLPLPKGDERVSAFWRIFGGTPLSIAARSGRAGVHGNLVSFLFLKSGWNLSLFTGSLTWAP